MRIQLFYGFATPNGFPASLQNEANDWLDQHRGEIFGEPEIQLRMAGNSGYTIIMIVYKLRSENPLPTG